MKLLATVFDCGDNPRKVCKRLIKVKNADISRTFRCKFNFVLRLYGSLVQEDGVAFLDFDE